MAGPKWKGGRLAGRGGGWAYRDRENISGGRGFASLRRDVPGRRGGSDGRRRTWPVLERSTSRTVETRVWNRHFVGWHRDGWIVIFPGNEDHKSILHAMI